MRRVGGGESNHRRWRSRPAGSFILRALIFLVPVVIATLAAIVVVGLLPEPTSTGAEVLWWVLLITAALVPLVVFGHLARKLLPLAMLLQLELAFPGKAPSRFRVARDAIRSRTQLPSGDEAADAVAETLLALVASLTAHDRRTRGHSERVRVFAEILADEFHLNAEDRNKLLWAALLHDIGKLTVDREILNKDAAPTDTEWEVIHHHPGAGVALVEPLHGWLGDWIGGIAHHHEHYDGTGYPDGLKGEEISYAGRLVAVVDAFETMTAARPYKKPMTPVAAREELVARAGTHFDPDVVRAFFNVSLRKLWLRIGIATSLLQVPILGQAASYPVVMRLGEQVAGVAASAAAVGALFLGGVIEPFTRMPLPVRPPVATEPIETEIPSETVPVAAPPDRQDERAAERRKSDDPAPVEAPADEEEPSAPAPDEEEESGGDDNKGDDDKGDDDKGKDDDPPQAGPAARSFSGHVVAAAVAGVTQTEFRATCSIPTTQGADGFVIEIPNSFAEGDATFALSGSSTAPSFDLNVNFYGPDCAPSGAASTSDPAESGALPRDVRYAVVWDASGFDTNFTLRLQTAG